MFDWREEPPKRAELDRIAIALENANVLKLAEISAFIDCSNMVASAKNNYATELRGLGRKLGLID